MTQRKSVRDRKGWFKAQLAPIKAALLVALVAGTLGSCRATVEPGGAQPPPTRVAPSPTIAPSPAPQATATGTPAPSVPSIYGAVFHDWNGNGIQDAVEGAAEPALQGIRVCLDDAESGLCAVSDDGGQYLIGEVPPGEHALLVESDRYSYLFPSVDAAVAVELEALPVMVDGGTLVNLGLGEGPFTLPFLCTELGQVVGIAKHFDADIRPGQARDWMGQSQTADEYKATTFEVAGEVQFVAPAPAVVTHIAFFSGRYLVQLTTQFGVPWFPSNRVLQLYFSGLDEVSVELRDTVARGQTVGRILECRPGISSEECFSIRARYADTYGSHVFVDLFRDTQRAEARGLWTRENDPVCFPAP